MSSTNSAIVNVNGSAPRVHPTSKTMKVLRAIADWLFPREDYFFDYLEEQAHIARKAVSKLADSSDPGIKTVSIRNEVDQLEKAGDELVIKILHALSETMVTPIDREDLQHLSSRLDDILDLINLSARALVIFGLNQPNPPMVALIHELEHAVTVIDEMLPNLRRRDFHSLTQGSHEIHDIEKSGDRIFREELRRLFHDPAVQAKDILRAREVLDQLENAIDRCDQVAEFLITVAVKHA